MIMWLQRLLCFSKVSTRDIFDAGVTGFGVAAGTATTADVWKAFSDAYDDLVSGASSDTRLIWMVGIITGAGGIVLVELGRF